MTLYTVREVAQMFKVHEGTVRRWVAQGKLQSSKKGSLRFTDENLKSFMENSQNKVV